MLLGLGPSSDSDYLDQPDGAWVLSSTSGCCRQSIKLQSVSCSDMCLCYLSVLQNSFDLKKLLRKIPKMYNYYYCSLCVWFSFGTRTDGV